MKDNIQTIPTSHISSWLKDELEKIPIEKINEFTDVQLQALNIFELIKENNGKLARLAAKWDRFSSTQLDALVAMTQAQWDSLMDQIPKDDIALISINVEVKLSGEKLKKLHEKIASITVEDVAAWTLEQWEKIPIENLAAMSWETFQKIPLQEIDHWVKDQLNRIPIDQIKKFSDMQFQALNIQELIKVGTEKLAGLATEWGRFSSTQLDAFAIFVQTRWNDLVDQIPKDDIALIAKQVEEKLSAENLKKLHEKIASITVEDVVAWIPEKWERVPIENLAAMAWETLQQVPLAEIGKWTEDMWKKMPVDKLVKLTGDQISKIDPTKIGNLMQEYWNKVPVNHIVKFSTDFLKAHGVDVVAHLNASKIAYLSAQQWQAVPVGAIVSLAGEKLEAINYKALSGWTSEIWEALPVEKILNFAGKQIEQIPIEVVGNWSKDVWLRFNASAAVMFTAKQLRMGIDVLEDLTLEQLEKFDPSQLKNILSEFASEVRDKIAKASSNPGFQGLVGKYKELVSKAHAAKDAVNLAFLEWQKLQMSPVATSQEVTDAEMEYRTMERSYAMVSAELALETSAMDSPVVNSMAGRSFLTFSAASLVVTLSMASS